MTPPTKLVVGPWRQVNPMERSRSLRYGSKAHGFEVTGSETRYAGGYIATISGVIGVAEPESLPLDSGHGRYSHIAQRWFMQTARQIVGEVAG